MLQSFQFRTIMLLAALILILVGSDIALSARNSALRAAVNERQAYLQQTVQLDVLYKQLVGALAQLAVQHDDPQLKSLLRSQGIEIREGVPNMPPPPPPKKGTR